MTAREKATVAVDVVIFAVEDGRLKTLLVTVREGSFAGRRAFPGGLVGVGESLEDVAVRELGVRGSHQGIVLEQLRTFGDPDRDPSGRVVATAYLALVPDKSLVVPGRRYADSAWFSVDSLPPLAYDHDEMAEAARERLRAKLAYTNIVYGLLPPEFTFGELQDVYEIILGRALDRRNFRKKLLATGLLRASRRKRRGPHRPAQLFEFAKRHQIAVDVL